MYGFKQKKFMLLVTGLLLSGVSQAELVIQQTPAKTVSDITSVKESKVSTPANGELSTVPSDASINRLMQVMQIDDMMDGLIAQQQQMATAVQGLPKQLPNVDKDSIFSRKTQQQLQKILTKYSQVLGQQIDPATRRAQMINAYHVAAKQHYTQAEVDALIQFYDNPMGQQILQKQSQVSTDFLKTAIPSMVGDGRELNQVLPGLQQDIEKIFN